MNKQLLAAAVAGLFSIAAFAQASAPAAASAPQAAPMHEATAATNEGKPAAKHHHAKKQHKHTHKHAHKHAASTAQGEENSAPAADEAAPAKP